MFYLLACMVEDKGESLKEERSYPNDSILRISDAQVWGTHNSYHLAPSTDVVSLWNYSHLPLDEQLQRGIRQFELDIVYEPDTGDILVQHIPFLDPESTCFRLLDCLEILWDWSEANPWHFPLHILIEPKDESASWSIEGHFEEVDELLIQVWGDRMWTPKEQQGEYASVRESILSKGWPTLEVLRGHAVFVLLDSGPPRLEYTHNLSDISERVMFPLVPPEHDFAAYLLRDNPFNEEIPALVSDGFLVRSRGDADLIFDDERLEKAFSVGAHSVSVDTAESLLILDESGSIRCNPIATQDCTKTDLE